MSFTAAEPFTHLVYDLFFRDFGTTSTGEFRFEPNGTDTDTDTTTVTWVMNGDLARNRLITGSRCSARR